MSAPSVTMFRCIICRIEAPKADGWPVDDSRYPSWRCADAEACASRFLASQAEPDDPPRYWSCGQCGKALSAYAGYFELTGQPCNETWRFCTITCLHQWAGAHRPEAL